MLLFAEMLTEFCRNDGKIQIMFGGRCNFERLQVDREPIFGCVFLTGLLLRLGERRAGEIHDPRNSAPPVLGPRDLGPRARVPPARRLRAGTENDPKPGVARPDPYIKLVGARSRLHRNRLLQANIQG